MLLGVLGIVGLWLGGVDLRGSLGVRGEPGMTS